MVSPSFPRPFLYLVVASAAPFLLTQCKTTAKSYKDVGYDAAKLKTPPGHGLDRKDYPFDESGAYRKDWVKSNTGGRDRSAGAVAEAPPVVASKKSGRPAAGSSRKPGAGSSRKPAADSTSYPTYAEASAARSSDSYVGPASDTVGSASAPDGGADLALGSGGVELASAGIPSADPAPVKAAPPAPRYHKVVSGDTLFRLASKYDSSVSELKRVNGLKGDSIRVGQSLRLP